MKFAEVNGKRIEAIKGTKGICPGCKKTVIAKCGNQRLHHWAHIKSTNCDKWWESEKEWHRSWKNRFPIDWQECRFYDQRTGEHHIADVFTNHGLVIEFQHSIIDPVERTSREGFYKDMVWVVDGTRLKSDFKRFIKGIEDIQKTRWPAIFMVPFPEECFNQGWVSSKFPVVFDFLGNSPEDKTDDHRRRYLYCLMPKQKNKSRIMAVFSREQLIQTMINGEFGSFY